MLFLLLSYLNRVLYDTWFGGMLGVVHQADFRALVAAALSFGLVVGCGRPTIRKLRALKMGDSGETDAELLRAHAASKANVPTMGGVLICAAVAFSTLLLADVTVFLVQLGLIVLVWLAVLGGFDDYLKMTASKRGGGRQGLYAWEKLVFQLGLGLLVGIFLYRHGLDDEGGRTLAHVVNLPFQKTYDSPTAEGVADGLWYLGPVVFIAVSVLWVAGLSNATNITDGMDGLASGIGAVVAFGLVILALVAGAQGAARYMLVPYIPASNELAVLCGALAGACVGFLWWNCAPAHVFMGDTGSLAIGGTIAYVSLAIRQEFVVLAMCAVFVLEVASVMLQVGWFKWTRLRTGTGRRIFRVAPYHHHLHMGGWTESQVVSRLWIVSILVCVAALASLKLR